ncbi:MAG: lipoyl(octanoyl) transferase [Candidatus Hydrogenedentota bacterium]|nr:MAG: lipoyl(octanoyl) transferase [Candidatus Hydrogenedentota bacterium]
MEKLIPYAVQQKKAFFLFTEHDTVYTSGTNTAKDHILDKSIEVKPVRRGGSVTVHSSGQLMFYTVMPFQEVKAGLQGHIRHLEFAIIRSLFERQIYSYTMFPHSGVFTPKGKIAFIGIGLKKGSIFHGAGINIATDLNVYKPILSCGLTIPPTSFVDHISQKEIHKNEIYISFAQSLYKHFKRLYQPIEPAKERMILSHEQKIYANFDLFLHGLHYFNARSFWRAHEAWELYWHTLVEEKKRAVQFFIQWSMAYYKLQQQNWKGANSLLQKAENKLPVAKKEFPSLRANGQLLEDAFFEVVSAVKKQKLIPVVLEL